MDTDKKEQILGEIGDVLEKNLKDDFDERFRVFVVEDAGWANVKTLATTVDKLKFDLRASYEREGKLNQKIEKAEKDLQFYKKGWDNESLRANDQGYKIKELEMKLRLKEEAYKEVVQKLVDTESKLSRQIDSVPEKDKIIELLDELSKVRAELKEAQESSRTYRNLYDKTEKLTIDQANKIDGLTSQIRVLEAQLEKIHDLPRHQLLEKLASAQAQSKEKSDTISSLQFRIESLTSRVESLSQDIAGRAELIIRQDKLLEEKGKEIGKLSRMIQNTKDALRGTS